MCIEETGDGEPLVLLHGLGTTHHIWDPVLTALGGRRRVLAADLPGFGRSAPAGSGFDLGVVAGRLGRALARRTAGAPFDLVGHSLGGGVALAVAGRYAPLIRSLILVAPAGLQPLPAVPSAVVGAAAEAMFTTRRALAPLTDLPWGRRLLLAFAAAEPAALAPSQARLMVGASAGARRIPAATAAIARADLRPELRSLTAPLGLLWGDRDRTVPPSLADEILAERPDAILEMIEGAGHVPMVERPAAFGEALLDMLAALDNLSTTPSGGSRSVP